MRERLVSLVLILCTTVAPALADPGDYQPEYRRVFSGSMIQDKNFYVLTLLQLEPKAKKELQADPTLAAIALRMSQSRGTMRGTNEAGTDAAESLRFPDEEIAAATKALETLTQRSETLKDLVRGHLRPSGMYQRLSGESDDRMLAQAFAEAARGINVIIDRFALGATMSRPDIDGPSYEPGTLSYQRMLTRIQAQSLAQKGVRAFFEPSLEFALRLLAYNYRDEPARYEPLGTGENRAAMTVALKTDWKALPYASILVTGTAGRPGMAISAESRANCAEAARLFREKKAPFIVVSGGYISPKHTMFSQALEMKRELMFAHDIPASAILIEPHSRRATTHVRNAARILFSSNVPADKPSLWVTSRQTIESIASGTFARRAGEELGYAPAVYGKQISQTAVEFVPSIDSLQIDPRDPLDP